MRVHGAFHHRLPHALRSWKSPGPADRNVCATPPNGYARTDLVQAFFQPQRGLRPPAPKAAFGASLGFATESLRDSRTAHGRRAKFGPEPRLAARGHPCLAP